MVKDVENKDYLQTEYFISIWESVLKECCCDDPLPKFQEFLRNLGEFHESEIIKITEEKKRDKKKGVDVILPASSSENFELKLKIFFDPNKNNWKRKPFLQNSYLDLYLVFFIDFCIEKKNSKNDFDFKDYLKRMDTNDFSGSFVYRFLNKIYWQWKADEKSDERLTKKKKHRKYFDNEYSASEFSIIREPFLKIKALINGDKVGILYKLSMAQASQKGLMDFVTETCQNMKIENQPELNDIAKDYNYACSVYSDGECVVTKITPVANIFYDLFEINREIEDVSDRLRSGYGSISELGRLIEDAEKASDAFDSFNDTWIDVYPDNCDNCTQDILDVKKNIIDNYYDSSEYQLKSDLQEIDKLKKVKMLLLEKLKGYLSPIEKLHSCSRITRDLFEIKNQLDQIRSRHQLNSLSVEQSEKEIVGILQKINKDPQILIFHRLNGFSNFLRDFEKTDIENRYHEFCVHEVLELINALTIYSVALMDVLIMPLKKGFMKIVNY